MHEPDIMRYLAILISAPAGFGPGAESCRLRACASNDLKASSIVNWRHGIHDDHTWWLRHLGAEMIVSNGLSLCGSRRVEEQAAFLLVSFTSFSLLPSHFDHPFHDQSEALSWEYFGSAEWSKWPIIVQAVGLAQLPPQVRMSPPIARGPLPLIGTAFVSRLHELR